MQLLFGFYGVWLGQHPIEKMIDPEYIPESVNFTFI